MYIINIVILNVFLCFITASFEVTVNGKLIFSKLKEGSFPSFKEVGLALKINIIQQNLLCIDLGQPKSVAPGPGCSEPD